MLARPFTYSTGTRFVLAVILATLLALGLMASPAIAQAEAGDANLLIVDCSQVQTAPQQYNSGDAVAVSQGQYGDAIAVIAQDLDISQSQVNECLGGTVPDDTTTDDTTTDDTTTDDTTTDDNVGAVDNPKGVISSTIPDGELVNTGGISLPVVAAGLLLTAGLISAGAIIRRGR